MKKQLYDEKSQFPIHNMQYKDYPPLFVTVVGPTPYVLVSDLASKLSKQPVSVNAGIITIGLKNKRVSIYGCSDFADMIDSSKVCDLAVLDIDTLDMMHFEFLALLSAHGMCKTTAVVRNDNPAIKRRLYKEVGMKTFSEKNIWKLARMILETKARPVEWRCSHPYLVVDKFVDNCFYGYLRGGVVMKGMCVHITNLGDTEVAEISKVGDPCFQESKKLEMKKPVLYVPGGEIDDDSVSDGSSSDESSNDFLLFSGKKTRISNLKFVNLNGGLNEKDLGNDGLSEKGLSGSEINEKGLQETELKFRCSEGFKDKVGDIDNSNEDENLSDGDIHEELKIIKNSIKEFIDDRYQSDDGEENDDEENDGEENDGEENDEKKNCDIETFTEEKKSTDIIKEKNDNYFLNLKNKMAEEFTATDAELRKMDGLFFPGEYVKIAVDNQNFIPDSRRLAIIGFLQTGEEKMATIQAKVVRNKFYRGMVRNERLIVSMGWRKFVVTPYFSMKNSARNRMIKCMPLAMHCTVQFEGHHVQPGTPVCLIKDPFTDNFRISGQGTVTEVFSCPERDENDINVKGYKNFNPNKVVGDLLKKIKLVGYPHKIHQNTAIIKDMFNSEKEVIKFQSGCLKTVSGLRGEIKKPVGKNGLFRASFEGQILMKDIVFLACYVPINVLNDCFLFKSFDELQFLTEESRKKERVAVSLKELPSDNYLKEKYEQFEDEYEFKIPKSLEKQLPINKRRIVEDKVEIPISPEEQEQKEFRDHVERLRKFELKRIEKEKMERAIQNKKREENLQKIKKAGIVKNIIQNKRHKKRRK